MRSHPLWRGFWIAAALAAGFVLMGFPDVLGAFRLERRMLAFCGAVTVGGFLGALPGWLKKSARHPQRPGWRHCLRGFLCGMGLAFSFALAGDGRVLSAFLTGSAGAWGFGLAALAGGFTTVRMMGRKT